MKNLSLFKLLVLLFVVLSGKVVISQPADQWTWMIIMDGTVDPDIDPLPAINALEEVGSATGTTNIIVFYNTPGLKNVYYIQKEAIPNPAITSPIITYPHPMPADNITIPDIQNFMVWSAANYKADNYGLILWDHGSHIFKGKSDESPKGFMNDLKVWDLAKALTVFRTSPNGKKLSILGFDMCLMAWFETVHMLKNETDFLIASEMNQISPGWDLTSFKKMVPPLGPVAPIDFCGSLVNDYIAWMAKPTNQYDGTLSSCEIAKYGLTLNEFNNFSNQLIAALPGFKNAIKVARNNTWYPKFDTYGTTTTGKENERDLGDFALEIKNNLILPPALRTAANNLINSLDSKLINSIGFTNYNCPPNYNLKTKGLKIWWPETVSTEPNKVSYIDPSRINFNNAWYDFLVAYESAVPCVAIDAKVYLEGPYNASSDNMNITLNTSGHLPLVQPYYPTPPYYGNPTPVWLYAGTEAVGVIPPNMVDWILVEVRDAATSATATLATRKAQQVCILNQDGSITDVDGNQPVFVTSIDYGCFVVIWHRNHLAIMNATPIPEVGGVYSYDFSAGSTQVYGGTIGCKQLDASPVVWGMISGDGNADNQANNKDKHDVWMVESGLSGYRGGDFNLDSQVNNSDKLNFWKPNSGKASQIPN